MSRFRICTSPILNGVLALADGELDEGGAAALVGETARHVAAHATNDRAAIATPSALPGRAWLASEPVDGTPGHTYLVARRVWPAGERFPASVRWLPAESARRVGVRPRVPDGAAGCVVYRFASLGEADTDAAQLEAVNERGARVPFGAAGKRPSVAGLSSYPGDAVQLGG